MVANGVLVPSTSPWGAPILMVRKPKVQNGWRVCIDYRRSNALAVKQHYPLPKVQDTLDKIGKAKYFSSVDALCAFWQVPCSARTQPTTAVNFPWGKWEFTTMPMGIQAGSATYQRIMDSLCGDLHFAVAFIDDILIFSETWEQHLLDVAVVLDRIGGAGFTLAPRKCVIGAASCVFLGHLIDAQGIRPDPAKVAVLREASFPQNTADLHHWVGLAGHYSQFVPYYALLAEVLQGQIHSPQPQPSLAALSAFEVIKKVLTDEDGPVLCRPDFTLPFHLVCDAATSRGLGGLLCQQDTRGRERPIAYWSVRFDKSEGHWSPVEHECFAVRKAIEHFYQYLANAPFTVHTDSEPLEWMMELRRPKGRLANWIMDVQSLDFKVVHRPAKLNRASDALSRLALTYVPGLFVSPASRPRPVPVFKPPRQSAGDEPPAVLAVERPPPVGEALVLAREMDRRVNGATVEDVDSDADTVKLECQYKSKRAIAKWSRRRVGCLVTDGRRILVHRGYAHELCLPTSNKVVRNEPLAKVVGRALSIAMHEGSAEVSDTLADFAKLFPHTFNGESTKYVLLVCPVSQYTRTAGGVGSGEWLDIDSADATTLGNDDDCRALRRLQLFRGCDQPSGAPCGTPRHNSSRQSIEAAFLGRPRARCAGAKGSAKDRFLPDVRFGQRRDW